MAPSGVEGRVAIIGGGIAGLAAAYYLGRAGVPVDLFEAEAETGGLAGSFDFEGLMVERYFHFICRPDHELKELARELQIADRLVWRRTRTVFFHQGRFFGFTSPLDLLRFSPIPLWSRINLGLETLKWSWLSDWQKLDEVAARDWLIARLGQQAYEVIWSPLLTFKFGEYQDRVSAAWIWHRVHRVAKSRRSPLHPQVMGYFEGGTETLLRALREAIARHAGRIHTRAPVQAVLARAGRVRGLRVGEEEREYQAVVMAAPLPQAAALLPAELNDYRRALEQVRFLGVVCLVLWLDQGLSRSFWCNVHDSRLPLNGLIEMSELNTATGRGGSLIYVPYYLPVTSPRFGFSDQEIVDEALQALAVLKPGLDRRSVRAFRVFRSRFAQAICTVGFRRVQPPHATPLSGLYLIDSTQLYPSDRTLSGTIGLAQKVSRLVQENINAHSHEK